MATEEEKQVRVVMIPLPAQGHLNQLLHLSRLIATRGIPVHYAGAATHNRQAKTRVRGWDPLANSNIHFHDLPFPSSSSLPSPSPDPNSPKRFPTHLMPLFFATIQLLPSISSLLRQLANSTRRLIVIHDSLMKYLNQEVSLIPNAESYCFHTCSAFTLYSFIWEMAGKPDIPESDSLIGLAPWDTCFPPDMAEFAKLQEESKVVNSGNLYNTSRVIEGRFLDLLGQFRLSDTDKNWAIGPFNPVLDVTTEEEKSSVSKTKRHYSLEWLDKQLPNSVIFVSFGTTTSLPDKEIKEMAIGLEKSKQKFIWVVRDADKADVFEGDEGEVRRAQLPEDYEKRIEGRGIIIRDWAPQLEILRHKSTGGFMSHCGWNSCIESISMGVPIAAWPMHSDQPRNAVLLVKCLKIGITVRDWESRDEVVKAETIEDCVRRMMDSSEGEEMRKRAEKLSEDVKKSVMAGGQSYAEFDSFIAHISR